MRLAGGLAGIAALAAGVAIAATSGDDGRIGPQNRIQPSGRLLKPYGKLTGLGNLPAGGSLTPDGRFLWTVSAGRGNNDVRIVKVAEDGRCPKHHGHKCRVRRARQVGKLVQVIPMPGADGGMTMAPDNRTAYVSGTKDPCDGCKSGTHLYEGAPKGTPGMDGDNVHVFEYDRKTGQAHRTGVIDIPPPPG